MSINSYMDSEIENEINAILNDNNPNSCCQKFEESTSYSVNGVSDILKIIDFTYLIPNLFRKCYLYNPLPIPNICIKYAISSDTVQYLPILLEENLIKSFLYFNFPVNIQYYNNLSTFVNSVINYKDVIYQKSFNATYGSYTPGTILYKYIYSTNSMLDNLLKFNYLMSYNSNRTYGQLITCPYTVLWDYTTGCVTTKNYIVSVYKNNNVITQTSFDILNYLRYTFFNEFLNSNINQNEILLIYKSNIYKILDYAEEVYADIISLYDSIMKGTDYCYKDYMNINNLPLLMKLYNNFYNNQIYSYNNDLPVSSIISLVPTTITIQQYINNFIKYFNDNNLGKILNTVILNENEAFIFCYKFTTPINPATIKVNDYLYYYINVSYPSSIQLSRYWGQDVATPYYNGKPLSDFVSDFFNGTTGHTSYLTTVKATSYSLIKNYLNGGLYLINSPPYEKGQVYYVYNDIAQTSLNSKVYLTFSTDTNQPIGLPIVFYPLIGKGNQII